MRETMNEHREGLGKVLLKMYEELSSENFSSKSANHKKKMKTAINALQGIVNYMEDSVVERKVDNDVVCERNGTKL